jgi:hypothetical protein
MGLSNAKVLEVIIREKAKQEGILASPEAIDDDAVTARAWQEFGVLKAAWLADTQFLSNIAEKSLHPAYQSIIGLGAPAVRLMLEDFERGELLDWFWALRAITRADPVSDEKLGHMKQMAEAWITWGRTNHYLNGLKTSSRPSPT